MAEVPANSRIAEARSQADRELQKGLSTLDLDHYGDDLEAFLGPEGFVLRFKLLFFEEATQLFAASLDHLVFKSELPILRERLVDEYARDPGKIQHPLSRKRRKRLERPSDLEDVHVEPTDKWDLFASFPFLPNKKLALRKELLRVTGQQLGYWHKAAERSKRATSAASPTPDSPSLIVEEPSPEGLRPTGDEALTASTVGPQVVAPEEPHSRPAEESALVSPPVQLIPDHKEGDATAAAIGGAASGPTEQSGTPRIERARGKRGTKPMDKDEPTHVARIIKRVAPDGNWQSKLDDVKCALDHGVCEAPNWEECQNTDHPKIQLPRGWKNKKATWLTPPDDVLFMKAIKERLKRV